MFIFLVFWLHWQFSFIVITFLHIFSSFYKILYISQILSSVSVPLKVSLSNAWFPPYCVWKALASINPRLFTFHFKNSHFSKENPILLILIDWRLVLLDDVLWELWMSNQQLDQFVILLVMLILFCTWKPCFP